MLWRSFARRNITSRNWSALEPVILQQLAKAEFFTVDLELTGLHSRNERFIGVDRCYDGHAEGARQFIPVQLGLCGAYRPDPSKNHWTLMPISVYLYPRGENDKVFQCSSATMNFLSNNGFNFNEWIDTGVGFLRPSDEAEKLRSVQERMDEISSLQATTAPSNPAMSCEPLEIPEGPDREVADLVKAKITEWLDAGSAEPLEIPMENAFQRLLMHTMIAQQFPQIYSHSARREDHRVLMVYKSQAEVYTQQLQTLEVEKQKVSAQVGVRKLLDAVSQSKKLVIGHNCFYDMLHLHQTFYGDLPSTVQEFKSQWLERFPHAVDTKYLAETHELLANMSAPSALKGLGDFLAAQAAENPSEIRFSVESIDGTKFKFPAAYGKFYNGPKDDIIETTVDASLSDNSHNAGYDAMMTSLVFLFQMHHIFSKRQFAWQNVEFGGPRTYGRNEAARSVVDLLPMSINRVRLVKTQPAMINLSGRDEADMSRHFHMRDIPTSWKKWEVMKVWSPVWVNISWIDDSSCWIICRSDEDVENIKMIHKMISNPQFKLSTYEDYKTNTAAKSGAVSENGSGSARSRNVTVDDEDDGKQFANASN